MDAKDVQEHLAETVDKLRELTEKIERIADDGGSVDDADDLFREFQNIGRESEKYEFAISTNELMEMPEFQESVDASNAFIDAYEKLPMYRKGEEQGRARVYGEGGTYDVGVGDLEKQHVGKAAAPWEDAIDALGKAYDFMASWINELDEGDPDASEGREFYYALGELITKYSR